MYNVKYINTKEGDNLMKTAQLFGLAQGCCLAYGLLFIPVSIILPPQLSLENRGIEMIQNVVLAALAVLCLIFWRKTSKCYVHTLWLAASAYFLLLLGRELSWGRVFFPTGMDSHGPTFIAMRDVPYHYVIEGVIGLWIAAVVVSLVRLIPWKKVLRELPFPTVPVILLAASAVIAALGDQGAIVHTETDEMIEELAELLVYILYGYIAAWYYYWFYHDA